MAKTRFTVSLNDKALNRQLQQAMQRNPKETVRAVKEVLLHLSAESAKRAPIETGDLRNNCHADLNGTTVYENQKASGVSPPASLKAVGTVGYSLPYALRQHEDLSLRHSGPEHGEVDGGEAKFLERPFLENTQRYIKRLQKIPEEVIK